MMRFIQIRRLFAVAALLIPPLQIHAADTEAGLIQSMEERLPAVMSMKLSGEVGENNLGLLEIRGELERDQRKWVSAENRDRNAHYALLAVRLEVPVKTVQQKRAEQIRNKSPKGVWIQSALGNWSQK
ncbi:MAG: DUF1318 domain-containing protein [Lentimonas sp.]